MCSTYFERKKKKNRDKLIFGKDGGGIGVKVGVRVLGLELVSRVVFWAFFELSAFVTLEPHAGHPILPCFYIVS